MLFYGLVCDSFCSNKWRLAGAEFAKHHTRSFLHQQPAVHHNLRKNLLTSVATYIRSFIGTTKRDAHVQAFRSPLQQLSERHTWPPNYFFRRGLDTSTLLDESSVAQQVEMLKITHRLLGLAYY
jgi:hypothetical protein